MRTFFSLKDIKVTEVFLVILFIANLWLKEGYATRKELESLTVIIQQTTKTVDRISTQMELQQESARDHETRLRALENERRRASAQASSGPVSKIDTVKKFPSGSELFLP